ITNSYSFVLPPLDILLGEGGSTRSYPSVEIAIQWGDVWDGDIFLLDNFENEEYGRDRGILTTQTINESVNVTLPDGSTTTVGISQYREVWDYSALDYMISIRIFAEDDQFVMNKTINPLLRDYTGTTIPLENLHPNKAYSIEVETIHSTHKKVEAPNPEATSAETNTNLSAIKTYLTELPCNSTEKYGNDPDEILENYINETDPDLYAILYKPYFEWEEFTTRVALDCDVQLLTPTFGYSYVNPPNEGTYFLNITEVTDDYRVWVYDPITSQNWENLDQNGLIKYSFLYEGYGSTTINNESKIQCMLLFPVITDRSKAIELPEKGTLEAHGVVKNYPTTRPYEVYDQILNTPSAELTLENILDHSSLLAVISPYVPSELVIDQSRLLKQLFLFYNRTTCLFGNNYEDTLEVWRVLDIFGISGVLFSQETYNQVFMSYFNRSYHEELDKKGDLQEVAILMDENNPGRKTHDTYIFIQLLTYNSPWIKQAVVDPSSSIIWNNEHEGVMLPRFVESSYGQLLETTSNEVYEELYTTYGTDLKEMIQQNQKSFLLSESLYLDKELMYWLHQVFTPTIFDLALQVLVSCIIGLCLLVSTNEIFPFRKKILAGIMALIIIMQGFSTPILFSEFYGTLSEYVKATQAMFEMLEEGVYGLAQKVGRVAGMLLIKPLEVPQDILGTTTSTLPSQKTYLGNATDEAYRQYVHQFQQMRTAWDRYYGTSGGTRADYSSDIIPKSYNEYLIVLSGKTIDQYTAQKLVENEEKAKVEEDRENQRILKLGFLDDIAGHLGSSSKRLESAVTGSVGDIYRRIDDGVAYRNAIRNDLAIKHGFTQETDLFDTMHGVLGETAQYMTNTRANHIIPRIGEDIGGATTYRYTDIYDGNLQRVFNYVNSFDDIPLTAKSEMWILENIMALTRMCFGNDNYRVVKYLSSFGFSSASDVVDTGKMVGTVIETDDTLSFVIKRVGGTPEVFTIRKAPEKVMLDDLILDNRLGLAEMLDIMGGNAMAKNIELVEFTEDGLSFINVASADEVGTLISTVRSQRYVGADGLTTKSLGQILAECATPAETRSAILSSDDVLGSLGMSKSQFVDSWNRHVLSGGVIDNDLREIADAIDPNLGKGYLGDQQWMLYDSTDYLGSIFDDFLYIGNPEATAKKIMDIQSGRANLMREGIEDSWYSLIPAERTLTEQEKRILSVLYDEKGLGHMEEFRGRIHTWGDPYVYRLKYTEKEIQTTLFYSMYEYWKYYSVDKIKVGDKTSWNDLLMPDCIRPKSQSPVVSTPPKSIEFTVVKLDQSELLRSLKYFDDAPTAYEDLVRGIVQARLNKESATFTLQDVIDGGWKKVKNPTLDFK
ncbi:MAG: hypothetical protein ACFFC6_17025, partial [Promethearchaeota archaeon]